MSRLLHFRSRCSAAVALLTVAFGCSSSTPTSPNAGTGGAPVAGRAGSGGVGSGGASSSNGGSKHSAAGSAVATSSAGASAGTAGQSAGTGAGPSAGVAGRVGAGGAGDATGGGSAGGPAASPTPANVLVTSSESGYWKTGTWAEAVSGTATVTVNVSATAQKWDGFGAAFNERGWSYLTTKEMQDQALKLLFSGSDGAAFAWGRVPIGASDYAVSRYTLDDTSSTDVTPNSDESNRPAADFELSKFSLDRDAQMLIPYIKAAQGVNPSLRFWASPWTPPVWMKTGYKKNSGADTNAAANVPSYFDGGSAKSDSATLQAYAAYYTKFVQGYKDRGIKIELVSPQNEPGYDQNYPSCLWDKTTYATWIGQYLGPAMTTLGVKIMLGTLSNETTGKDADNAIAALADPAAKGFLTVIGAQWGMLDASKLAPLNSSLPVWATEHKCGNYPFCTDAGWCGPSIPAYNSAQAPNDQAYGVESWGYIRNAITQVKVTAYNAWNMVLDKNGLGNDTTREWKQDALIVADAGMVKPTPAYYVFRHLSQYVVPGATVLGTTGGDAVAFKNADGSIVVVAFNSGAANDQFVVGIGGKLLQFAMPANGWATVKYTP